MSSLSQGREFEAVCIISCIHLLYSFVQRHVVQHVPVRTAGVYCQREWPGDEATLACVIKHVMVQHIDAQEQNQEIRLSHLHANFDKEILLKQAIKLPCSTATVVIPTVCFISRLVTFTALGVSYGSV